VTDSPIPTNKTNPPRKPTKPGENEVPSSEADFDKPITVNSRKSGQTGPLGADKKEAQPSEADFDKPVTVNSRKSGQTGPLGADKTASRKPTTIPSRKPGTPTGQPASQSRAEYWLAILLFGLGMFGLGAVVGGVGGVMIFIRLTGGTGEPSEPISAPTLEVESTTHTAMNMGAVGSITPTLNLTTTATPVPTVGIVSSPVPVATTAFNSTQLFRIVAEESEVRFAVDETFPAGTAIGRTNQIAGNILVDFDTPSKSRLGAIRINLRTLQTDSSERDQSIRCCVLLSAQDEHEFTDFIPTSLVGLPDQVIPDQPIMFQVVGDLTLRGIKKPVTFDVTLTVTARDLRGTAKATINRSDFNLIDDEHLVEHGVAQPVTLEFDFVAEPVTS
jgi:polyisoprenoid-binding protein YceI